MENAKVKAATRHGRLKYWIDAHRKINIREAVPAKVQTTSVLRRVVFREPGKRMTAAAALRLSELRGSLRCLRASNDRSGPAWARYGNPTTIHPRVGVSRPPKGKAARAPQFYLAAAAVMLAIGILAFGPMRLPTSEAVTIGQGMPPIPIAPILDPVSDTSRPTSMYVVEGDIVLDRDLRDKETSYCTLMFIAIVASFRERIRLRAKWRSNLQFRAASNVGLLLLPGGGISLQKN